MKILILLLSAGLFLGTSLIQEESPELKEAADLSDSAIKLINQKKFDEALPLAKRALQIREKLLPRTDPRVRASLHRVGDLYLAKRDYDAARQTFERLLKILEEQFGPTDWNLGGTLDRLALLYHREGNMSKAENLYQRALAVREKKFGPDNAQVAESLYQLGQFYRLRRDFDRAYSNYKRALLIYGELTGVLSPEFVRAGTGLSCLGYESENKEIIKEFGSIHQRFAPGEPMREPLPVINGMAIYLAKPDYPLEARVHQLSGKVIVLAEIDETGKVIRASDMCQGLPYLSESCIKAALKSRFTPTKLSGKPVKVKGIIQYNFVRT